MKRVIIVDDLATNRRVMSMLISRVDSEADLHVFADPIEALLYANRHTPNLLITDFKMPLINGIELIRRFRDFPLCAQVPAVMVTAHQDCDARRLAFEAGTTDFLSLPIDYAKFCEKSRALLALSDHRNNTFAVSDPVSRPISVFSEDIGQIALFNRLLEATGSRLLQKASELNRVQAEMESMTALCDKPVVVVDKGSEVRWFTKAIAEVFCLDRSSIGVPLTSSVCKVGYGDLGLDILLAWHSSEVFVRHLRSAAGDQFYEVKLIPNKSDGAAVTGVTLVFERISKFDFRSCIDRTWH